MARGRDAHQARLQAVAGLGRLLARRARSKCEICECKGQRLTVIEVPPVDGAPEADRAIMICESCQRAVEGGKLDADHWRILEGLVWSELPPVQVVAVRLTRRVRDDGVSWAGNALDGLYLEPDIEAWVDGA